MSNLLILGKGKGDVVVSLLQQVLDKTDYLASSWEQAGNWQNAES